jgi:hypothetical protein
MRSVYVVYVLNTNNELVELEIFSKKEDAKEYESEMDKLYDLDTNALAIGFWERTVDKIHPSSRQLEENPITGFKSTMGIDPVTGEYPDTQMDTIYTGKEIESMFRNDESIDFDFRQLQLSRVGALHQAMYNCVTDKTLMTMVDSYGDPWQEEHNRFVQDYQRISK